MSLTADQRAECIRLRVEERLSTNAIALRMRLRTARVRAVLAEYPISRLEIRQRRVWAAVRTHEKRAWPQSEVARLGEIYATATKAQLLAEFPGRTIQSIRKRANLEGWRCEHGGRFAERIVDPTFARLRAIRLARRISLLDLAARIGVNVGTLGSWEMGRGTPSWRLLKAWLGVLGVRLEAIERQLPASGRIEPWVGIKAPTRDQLMARRAA